MRLLQPAQHLQSLIGAAGLRQEVALREFQPDVTRPLPDGVVQPLLDVGRDRAADQLDEGGGFV
ncbi:hypothetical protein RB623_25265 [Mesorhizobium sp. LHD-90]|uniref:hypothetical protein n=1 Tax=Mesorhizobium sp. LHD-90 TaxID=3071414 RepID=UPI0027E0F747|nr:hypothetical protein [Mesorhizobium sp. LHD-90]MDQ6437377.1 hypothetical protein [Mesorhizobium sp. LHD-90]